MRTRLWLLGVSLLLATPVQAAGGKDPCTITCDRATLSFRFVRADGSTRTITFLTPSAFGVAVRGDYDFAGGACPGTLKLKDKDACFGVEKHVDLVRFRESFPETGPLTATPGAGQPPPRPPRRGHPPYEGPFYDPKKPGGALITVRDPKSGATITTRNDNLPRRR